MISLPKVQKSYWKETAVRKRYPALRKNITVDVVIVGGGITGLTTAYLLKKSGLKVAVLEKNQLASGTTGGTTGKITSQHGLIYDKLQKKHGKKVARLYAEANENALKKIADIIKKEKIHCDFRRLDNYVYTTDQKQAESFKKEAKLAKQLGLPATHKDKLDLPLDIKAAVGFSNQATFHAANYVHGLAARVHGQGSYVFENSNTKLIHDSNPAVVATERATVTAKDIIIATKVPTGPLFARLAYAALEYPHTSYIVAGEYTGNLKGMYISPDDGQYSILPVKNGRKNLLLIGGENHIPGFGNSRHRQQKLANYAARHFGIKKIVYRWKAMDYIAYDYLPVVGKVYPWSRHLYTATGFKKWGLTTSMVAAQIMHDQILGKQNPLTDIFKPQRLTPITSIPNLVLQWAEKPKNAALVFGGIFLVIGFSGFCPLLSPADGHGKRMLLGLFEVEANHNYIHLLSGATALVSSLKSITAKIFFRLFGIVYGLVAVIGFVHGSSVLGLIHANLADNLLHLAIAAASLYIGFNQQ